MDQEAREHDPFAQTLHCPGVIETPKSEIVPITAGVFLLACATSPAKRPLTPAARIEFVLSMRGATVIIASPGRVVVTLELDTTSHPVMMPEASV